MFTLFTRVSFHYHFERNIKTKRKKELKSVAISIRIVRISPGFPLFDATSSRVENKFRVAFLNNTAILFCFSFFFFFFFLQKHFIDINEESDFGIIHGHPCELFRAFLMASHLSCCTFSSSSPLSSVFFVFFLCRVAFLAYYLSRPSGLTEKFSDSTICYPEISFFFFFFFFFFV